MPIPTPILTLILTLTLTHTHTHTLTLTLALTHTHTLAQVKLYGFSMASTKFHYFDSMVQEAVTEAQRDPTYGYTHRFAWEHEVFRNWSLAMPDRFELHQ